MAVSAEGAFELGHTVGQRTMSEELVSEDVLLVGAARDGSREAFGCLYGRYARMVHGVLLTKVPPAEVDDLVQDVFIAALRRLSTLREPAKFGAWIAAIARNRAHDFHRNATPVDSLEDEVADEVEGRNSDDDGRAAAVLAAVKGLPETYRETLILRLVEGMTGPEIAARTGLTHGSVRVNLHRGMQLLRAKLSLSEGANGGME
jgi:RNA polymerase sigma-70 factor (ECF subfamily)